MKTVTRAQHQLPLSLPSADPSAQRRPIPRSREVTPEQAAAFRHHKEQQQGKTAWLWAQRQPIEGTIVEAYLRKTCGISCALPPTLGFLPTAASYPCAMICAFGFCAEPSPGTLVAPSTVSTVLIVALRNDGTPARGPRARTLLGQELGTPIMLAPVNDNGGLAITVTPEDALAAHQATGLGAWASGHASRLPALARSVPAYVSAVTLLAKPGSAAEAGARLFIKILERSERSNVELTLQEAPP